MRAICSLVFVLVSTVAFAQLEPVQWSFEVEKLNDKEYDIIFSADIDRGWALYSQFMEAQNGPIPTSFEFYRNNQIELVGDASETGLRQESFDEVFGMNLVKYKSKARFVQRVKVGQGAERITGHLTYMTCDDKSCLPPEDVNFEIALK